MFSPSGITPTDYNYLKCWVALTKEGTKVFLQIFHWGYKAPLADIKKKLFLLPNYSNAQYRKDFSATQRDKIERGNVEEFDLTLLYDLLQKICHLPSSYSEQWNKNSSKTSDSLPHLLYKIKMKRNAFAHHTKLTISNHSMQREIDELIALLCLTLDAAAVYYDIHITDVNKLKIKLCDNLQAIKTSELKGAALNIHRASVVREKQSLLLKQGKSELARRYKPLLQIQLMFPSSDGKNRYKHLTDIFVEPLLKKSSTDQLFQQIDDKQAEIELQNIFTLKMADGRLPEFMLLFSQSGRGKTTIAKYIINEWLENTSNIKELQDNFDLVFYIDCRVSNNSTLSQFFEENLSFCHEIFGNALLKSMLLKMKLLFILDNFDEMNDCIVSTVEEIMRINSPDIRILATAKQKLSSFSNTKKILQLQLKGVTHNNMLNCLNKIFHSFEETVVTDSKVNTSDLELFCEKYIMKGEFHESEYFLSPETLHQVFYQWVMKSKVREQPFTPTNSQIFLITYNLLLEKILSLSSVKNSSVILERQKTKNKLENIFKDIFRQAFLCFKSMIIDANFLISLTDNLQTLNLPYQFIIPEIFCLQETTNFTSLKSRLVISFPTFSQQIFYCAMHIFEVIKSNTSTSIENIISEIIPHPKKSNYFIPLMKNILGIITENEGLCLRNNIIQEIFDYIAKNFICSTNLWLELIEETQCNQIVVNEITRRIGKLWRLTDKFPVTAIQACLKIEHPDEIDLTLSENPRNTFGLKCILEICSKLNLKFSLKLYYDFWVEKHNYSDEYLSSLDFKRINFYQLAGRISANFLSLLPSNLRRLALHISPNDIRSLNEILLKLNFLEMLYINLDIELNFQSKNITRIKIPRRETIFCLDVWNIDGENVEWACDIISGISPCFCRLALRKSSLRFEEAFKFIKGLREGRIHADSLTIGSVFGLTQEESNQLKEIASSFQCFEFKWIQIL